MTKQHILVIGTGSIGTRHAGNIEQLGGSAERLSLRELGLEGVVNRITNGPEAQGAVIATATQIRQPLIEACSARGLPVYVEKPVAYTKQGLADFYAAASFADRSVAGFMMRYHPLLPKLQEIVAQDQVFRFDFEIGHDVTQWRANWSFGDSYAALPEGGGVLLDLCHELDLAHTLFPDTALKAVESLGHADFPGVDMATQIALSGPAQSGSVAMDYLAPVFSRMIRLRGQEAITECDLLTGTITRRLPDADPEITQVEFDRNAMFLGAMADFMALIDGRETPSGNPNIPRLDLARPSCEMIATAWASRNFCGTIEKDMT
ncbi:MAG: Gfo/Idh/MocA family protein [Thalassovita sp.]